MRKYMYSIVFLALALCLTGCAFQADEKTKDVSEAENREVSQTDDGNTDTSPQETPVSENMMTKVSVLEQPLPEEERNSYDASMKVSNMVISGVYMDEKIPNILVDFMAVGLGEPDEEYYYSHEYHRYRVLTGLEPGSLEFKISKKDEKKMHPANGMYAYNYCNRMGVGDMGKWYEFSQIRHAKVTEGLPELWLFDKKRKLEKHISWIPLTGIDALKDIEKDKTDDAANNPQGQLYNPYAYTISDIMHGDIMYFTFVVIYDEGEPEERHEYYYAALDVEKETMLSCEKINFEWPKIYGDYLVGITPDYANIITQNTKTGEKTEIANTAGQNILGYTMYDTTVYWMDMDNLYWRDILSGKTGTQPMNLREAIGDNTLMHNNTDEGWWIVHDTLKTESCARNNLTVSEDGKLYGVFWSYSTLDKTVEINSCSYMVLKFEPTKDSAPASPD